MKIIYMGTPEFAVEPLKRLKSDGHEILAVVTQPDRPKNRGKKMLPPPVKEAALEMGLEVLQPEKIRGNEEFIGRIRELDADVAVVAAFGQILPKEVLEAPKLGCLNIHASLLPKLRGAAPIQRALMEGYLYSGITIMKMDEGLDTGDMITKRIVSITGMTADMLHDELMEMGADMISDLLGLAETQGEEALRGEPQDDSQATYAPRIDKKEALIDFHETADDVFLKINAMDSWPGAYTYYKGRQMKMKDPEWYGSDYKESKCGEILKVSDQGIIIKCRDSQLLVKTIQFPGKRAMSVKEFIRGNELETGVILGQE
ncbi:MAG: methionyl-tRNA formyltransferase [Firmicutes bacterium]|nr:methionyl-tRNA formyltransferase [Bacillota bacterium]